MLINKYRIYIFLVFSVISIVSFVLLPNVSLLIFISYVLGSLLFFIYLNSWLKPSEDIYSNLTESFFSSIYSVSQKENLPQIVANTFSSHGIKIRNLYIFLEDDSGILKFRGEGNKLKINSILKVNSEFIKFLKSSKYKVPFIEKRNTTLLPSYVFSEINEYLTTTNSNIMFPIYTPDNDIVGIILANLEKIEIKKLIYLSKLLNIIVLSFREIEMSSKRKVIEEDLKIAVDIQRKLIPTTFVDTDFFDSYGFYKPAYKVGGDYIDIIKSSKNFIFAVGDVSGKGVSAGLVTMIVKSILNSIEIGARNLNSSIKRLNSFIYNWFYDQESTITFITLLMAMFIPSKNLLYYVNAGHVPGIIVSPDGKIRELKTTSTPIGLFEVLKSRVEVVNVSNGDVMVLYTDGLIEQIDKRGREFGVKRLISVISDLASNSPREIVSNIIEEFEKFSGSESSDDIAILVIKFK